ncbi:hypothetical protein [Atopococcus tabaci]|uniref:hypothetical protein n=1 Tax=Atopococcus tabaci TaxID=269774 RepID=UPI002409EBB7|nr:hypothetical protein [Atopococcus tabaci]
MSPKYAIGQKVITMDRSGNDWYARIMGVSKVDGDHYYHLHVENGTQEHIKESDLEVLN